jgi:hypothetical protein
MSSTSNAQIHCDDCWTMTETKVRDIKLTRYGRSFSLKNVETNTCPNCDNFYLSGETLDRCEALIQRELIVAA